jgi:hypothetical protein
MEPELGIFRPVFVDAHHYLELLHLSFDDAPLSVELVRDCCRTVANPYPDICRLLEGLDWRPHLVAAVAVIVSGYHSEAVECLWRRFDTGSWVTPQIGVALYLVDPDFAAQSRIRLDAGCPVDLPDLMPITDLERHSGVGPGSEVQMSAKAAATLLHLLAMISPVPNWLEGLHASEGIRELLARDVDAADMIADKWLCRIEGIIGGHS